MKKFALELNKCSSSCRIKTDRCLAMVFAHHTIFYFHPSHCWFLALSVSPCAFLHIYIALFSVQLDAYHYDDGDSEESRFEMTNSCVLLYLQLIVYRKFAFLPFACVACESTELCYQRHLSHCNNIHKNEIRGAQGAQHYSLRHFVHEITTNKFSNVLSYRLVRGILCLQLLLITFYLQTKTQCSQLAVFTNQTNLLSLKITVDFQLDITRSNWCHAYFPSFNKG